MKNRVLLSFCLSKYFFASIFWVLLAFWSTPDLQAQWGSRAKSEAPSRKKHKKGRKKHKEEKELQVAEISDVDEHEIAVNFDKVVKEWDEVAEYLGTYDGMLSYCEVEEFQDRVDGLLGEIHHYDTLLYGVLQYKKHHNHNSRELRKTLAEIEKVEHKYNPKNFHRHLNEDCRSGKSLERNRKKLANDIHMNSYDGKTLILDNEIHTYIRHITHLVDLVDKHILHLLE